MIVVADEDMCSDKDGTSLDAFTCDGIGNKSEKERKLEKLNMNQMIH